MNNIVYVKTENGIFKCYKSEQMNKPIYHPVNSNGFIDYNDVEKIVTIDDLFKENQELKKQLNEKIALEIKLKEELEDKRKEYQEVYKDVREEIKDYKNQQKEFIEYLEKYIEEVDNNRKFHKMYSASEERLSSKYHTLQAVLSKYKEIIGGDNK